MTAGEGPYGATGPGTARLVISCPDRPGIVAAVSRFLFERDANIVTSDQYSTDPEGGTFFMRMTFFLAAVEDRRADFEAAFADSVAEPFGMTWRVAYGADRRRVALMVSRYDHCLLDLLWRWRRDLDMDVTQVISNHGDLRADVEAHGVPYRHIPVPPGGKPEAETLALSLLGDRTDLVILARYMQILSGDFLERVGCPVINIHHSFLPAFAGGSPYARARERGVKLIGATAHYVTEELDAGPIIEQDILRVNHRYTPHDLERVGRDVERVVLARAVRSHLDDRVLVDGRRTVVF
jgi:formyltetrahydrofolate deformylase